MFFGYDFCEEKHLWPENPSKKRMGFFGHTPSGLSAVCKQRKREEKKEKGEKAHTTMRNYNDN